MAPKICVYSNFCQSRDFYVIDFLWIRKLLNCHRKSYKNSRCLSVSIEDILKALNHLSLTNCSRPFHHLSPPRLIDHNTFPWSLSQRPPHTVTAIKSSLDYIYWQMVHFGFWGMLVGGDDVTRKNKISYRKFCCTHEH